MNRRQCCAARALLGWTQAQLARQSGVGVQTVFQFEAGREPHAATLHAMKTTMELAGVVFIEPNGQGYGVRLEK